MPQRPSHQRRFLSAPVTFDVEPWGSRLFLPCIRAQGPMEIGASARAMSHGHTSPIIRRPRTRTQTSPTPDAQFTWICTQAQIQTANHMGREFLNHRDSADECQMTPLAPGNAFWTPAHPVNIQHSTPVTTHQH